MKKRRWILLAEDTPNDADLTLRALGDVRERVDVVMAHDGAEALDCMYRRGIFAGRSGSPALVLLDLKMPKISGLEVLQRIKNDPALRAIPVIVFTSSREQNDVTRCYRAGANAYVVKPVKFQEFSTALKSLGAFWLAINEMPEFSYGMMPVPPPRSQSRPNA